MAPTFSPPSDASAIPRLEPAAGLKRWRELLAGADWLALRTSAVYYGFGVPRGDGAPVILVPGFMASDRRLMELYYWLIRIGYRPRYSGFGPDPECPDVLVQRLLRIIDRTHRNTGRRVRLIGHSLGGTIARSAAIQQPDRIAQVITLGSPIRHARVHRKVLTAAETASGGIRGAQRECYTGACTCDFVRSLERPVPDAVAHAAIYSKRDGVVDWRSCIDRDHGVNIEVRSTHSGLPFNPDVYREIARLLATVAA